MRNDGKLSTQATHLLTHSLIEEGHLVKALKVVKVMAKKGTVIKVDTCGLLYRQFVITGRYEEAEEAFTFFYSLHQDSVLDPIRWVYCIVSHLLF